MSVTDVRKLLDNMRTVWTDVGIVDANGEDDAFWVTLQAAAKNNNCRIYLPSGAICGIDGIKAVAVVEPLPIA